jgi:hypothetical protein
MTKVNISIDPTSPIHKELEKEILGYIDSLETVTYQKVMMPSEPGKLSGVDQDTIKIAAEVGAAVLQFIVAIMQIASQVSASKQKAKETDKKKPIDVEVEGVKISLPVRDETARKYIRTVEIKIKESSSVSALKKQSPKKSHKK